MPNSSESKSITSSSRRRHRKEQFRPATPTIPKQLSLFNIWNILLIVALVATITLSLCLTFDTGTITADQSEKWYSRNKSHLSRNVSFDLQMVSDANRRRPIVHMTSTDNKYSSEKSSGPTIDMSSSKIEEGYVASTEVAESEFIVHIKQTHTDEPLMLTAAKRKFKDPNISNFGILIGSLLSDSSHDVRNLVLGVAVNTDSKNLAIFCGSLRQVSDKIDGVIFVNSPVPQRHIEIAKQYQVVLVEYDTSTILPSYLRSFHPSSLRWILFNRFLDARGENLGTLIKDCGWNSGWIRDCFGEHVLSLVGNNTIICSGISMATADRAAEYLHLFSRILMGDGEGLLNRRFPSCERNGVDQGVHNVVMHLGLLPSQSIETESSFPVTHLQSTQTAGAYDFNKPDYVTSQNNPMQPLAIVHQYDRIHTIQLALAKRYVTWVDITSPQSAWNEEEACGIYDKVEGIDMFQGICDAGSFRSMLASSCCALCDSRKGTAPCNAFAFSEGVCYFKSCSDYEIANGIAAKARHNLSPQTLPQPLAISGGQGQMPWPFPADIVQPPPAPISLMSAYRKPRR